MGAIAMMVLAIVIAVVGVIFFTIQDRKKAEQLKVE